MRGTVIWYNAHQRFGFIKGEDKKRYYVSHRQLFLVNSLNKGDIVEFEHLLVGNKAMNVKKVS